MSSTPEPRIRLPKPASLILAGTLTWMAGCAATSPTVTLDASPKAMFQEMVRDLERRGGSGGVFTDAAERSEVREAEILRRVEAGEIKDAQEHIYAGAILVKSSTMKSLLLAESLGRRATIMGNERGKPLAAEAVDRQALVGGLPQTYGTQYVYNVVTGNWQVYTVDPKTTDDERATMGLPPLDWFQGRVNELNESGKSDRLRAELHLPPPRDLKTYGDD